MAFDYNRIAEITTIPSTAGALITNEAGKTTYVRVIIIHNGNTSTETVKLYNVPDNAEEVGTAGATNIFYNVDIDANGTRILEFASPGIMLEDTKDTIQGVTDTASKVTFQAYGGIE